MKRSNIIIVDYEATCAAGNGLAELRLALASQRSGLRANDVKHSELKTFIGKVQALDNYCWAQDAQAWQSRNNALIKFAVEQGEFLSSVEDIKHRFAANRIGVIMGSSTSSIDRTEEAYRHLQADQTLAPAFRQENVLNPHSPGLYLAELCGIEGPTMTINTACSSSAKVFATAARWLRLGLIDAAIVGGADTLCLSVLHGFHALQLVSEKQCKPFDQNRDGINLGEAAGLAILVREQDAQKHAGIRLCGFGESSDAHHMSHPHPEGLGARLAIEQALKEAALTPESIDYVNLHGTASRANDKIEGRLISQMFSPATRASSTKAWMGHTLGAAGILESIVAFDALATHLIPGTLNLEQVDTEIPLHMSSDNISQRVDHVMSNSFGFGGNNCCVIFGRAH